MFVFVFVFAFVIMMVLIIVCMCAGMVRVQKREGTIVKEGKTVDVCMHVRSNRPAGVCLGMYVHEV